MTSITKLKINRILEQSMEEAFPDCDPGCKPLGSLVLLQVKAPATHTKSGFVLNNNDVETEADNTKVAKVLMLGSGAFRNRETLKLWPEGEWVKPGDYVRIGLYGGERWSKTVGVRKYENKMTGKVDEDKVVAFFALIEDLNIKGVLTGDPLEEQGFFR